MQLVLQFFIYWLFSYLVFFITKKNKRLKATYKR